MTAVTTTTAPVPATPGCTTLGEAIAVRQDLIRRFRALLNDATQCARRPAGDPRTGEPERILESAETVLDELEAVARLIARTTARATTATGEPLAEAIAASEVATLRRKLWGDVVRAASDERGRSWSWDADGQSIRTEPNLSLAGTRLHSHGAAAHAADVALQVQACQWSTPLVQ